MQLGAPNNGSFAPVQALRAVYPTVRKIAALDHRHSAEELARKVFLSLPGLYQMLPIGCERRLPTCSTFARGRKTIWPRTNPCWPHARNVRDRLADADSRCTLIAGVAQETITAIRLVDNQFEYSITP